MAKLVQQYCSDSAKKFPDKVAVSAKGGSASGGNFKDQNITFAELDRLTNQLARALQSRGVRIGDRVSFCLHKSINSIIAVLGILKADAIYVPLNAHAPAARLKMVTDDAQPRAVICDNKTEGLVKDFSVLFNLDKEKQLISSMPESELDYRSDSSDLAYILYTSGSTGHPKGVMISHSNIINATDWAVEEFQISESDRLSQHPPLHFDLSTFDLYCAFKAGATLYLVPEELSLFPSQLMKFIEDNQLTIWNSVPSVMVYLWNAGLVKPSRLKSIKKIFFNGEGFPTRFLAEWMKTYPDKEFINMYGPTETTVQCTFYRIPEPPTDLTKLVPIGKACRNVEVFAVKENGNIAAPGEIGELYVGGSGVGKGYWNNQPKTEASFIDYSGKGRVYKTGDLVRLRGDGNYEFIGRKDNQVKVMGNRIELGDVDSALHSLPCVKEAATVVVTDSETGGNQLIAFVNLKDHASLSEVKNDLGKILPPYMIPQQILERELPKTSTGKIDRIKLKNDYLRGKN